MQESYYTRLGGRVEGPFTLDELAERLANGKFSTIHEVSVDRTKWTAGSRLIGEIGPSVSRPRRRRRPQPPEPIEPEPIELTLAEEPDSAEPPALHKSRAGRAVDWSYTAGGRPVENPIPTDQLCILIVSGRVGENDHVWTKGMDEWVLVSNCEEFADALAARAESIGRASGYAVLTAVCGGVGYVLMLVCTVMLVVRMRSAPLVLSNHVGVISMTAAALVLGIATVVLGHLAIGFFKRRSGTSGERGLIVFGLSCGYTSVIVTVILGIGASISASEAVRSSGNAGHLSPLQLASDGGDILAETGRSRRTSDSWLLADRIQSSRISSSNNGL